MSILNTRLFSDYIVLSSALLLIVPLLTYSCQPSIAMVEEEIRWYKGNTHAHTTLCGHADSAPDSVARWYLNRGYHFLVLSEHNIFIDPDSVSLPPGRRKDFILIPGQEVTGHRHIHTTALNTQELVLDRSMKNLADDLSAEERLQKTIQALRAPIVETKTEIMQRHTHDIRAAGGVPILNHPNFVTGAQAHEILPVQDLHMIELYNGHPDVHNWGNEQHASVEEKWDSLLTAGKLVLGVSSDDAHHFKEYHERKSNPGRGWVMVNSGGELDANAISTAMARGAFYATNGVMLKQVVHDKGTYTIIIDSTATERELTSEFVIGKIGSGESLGFVTQYLGSSGKLLQTSNALSSTYSIKGNEGYVRARIRYTRVLRDGSLETFYAWTQPQFLDDRAEALGSIDSHTH
ncbi:MAG: CehA/McbA family metallohydrolase [Saprospiraceae bacterium]|nr:CehA/McbA family metallohydrolase [Saprospiraceae bacterium]